MCMLLVALPLVVWGIAALLFLLLAVLFFLSPGSFSCSPLVLLIVPRQLVQYLARRARSAATKFALRLKEKEGKAESALNGTAVHEGKTDAESALNKTAVHKKTTDADDALKRAVAENAVRAKKRVTIDPEVKHVGDELLLKAYATFMFMGLICFVVLADFYSGSVPDPAQWARGIADGVVSLVRDLDLSFDVRVVFSWPFSLPALPQIQLGIGLG